ncbi:hypothetical protein DVA67_032190 [Solirubrobacter sp. CPCC 204708]|uniref:CHRD domain-containing protein n=1 Tax=Solirubrobacter deserti TaxID=2282478 RepID=A0ABT4RVE3_9ACTN|nr:hypothetical protein [Solirubrobacter deserti]MBE2320665.1 hypothetical protein [Solirubrobacter deserti]MDA0142430.1 hypothetical protein [Solirubrobacter deserti]
MRLLIVLTCVLAGSVALPSQAQAGLRPWLTLKGIDGYERKFRMMNCKEPNKRYGGTSVVLSGKTRGNLRIQIIARDTPGTPGRLQIWNGDKPKRGNGIFGSVTKVRLGGGDDENEKLRVEGAFTGGGPTGSWVLTGRCGCPGTCNGIPDRDGDGIPDDQDGRRGRA